jgi:hypothetical protein
MPEGGGVPGMQPALARSALVAGSPRTLVSLMLEGADVALPAGRPRYSGSMPVFASWSDADVSAVLSHMRRSFGNQAPPIGPAAVAAVRGNP